MITFLKPAVILWIGLFPGVPAAGAAGAAAPTIQTIARDTSVLTTASAPSEADIQTIKQEFTAQQNAAETVHRDTEVLGGVVILVSMLAFGLQIWVLVTDARVRRKNETSSEVQNRREAQLHERFLKVLDIASAAATDAQKKVAGLEEGGIRRAGETLQLINNLLTITERAAAKAAGAQFDFLTKTISGIDIQCRNLMANATKDEDRDIIAKPEFREEVRMLTRQIDALDNQIISYNESVPGQFADQPDSAPHDTGSHQRWSKLSLTGPCLFIRGQNHLQTQNFSAAITDWKLALTAAGADAIRVDANYWIGYVNNTLGNFEESPTFLQAAAAGAAPETRKPELIRLELETKFFAIDSGDVPSGLLDEGKKFFDTEMSYRVSARIKANFATTLGNMELIRAVRAAAHDEKYDRAIDWFQVALEIASRSRWARFGMYQAMLLAGKSLPNEAFVEIRDVIGSVNREYQSRVESRSKVLSKMTEYMCLIMLDNYKTDDESARLVGVAHSIESHSSEVATGTIYSQFRKQNVHKNSFLKEFHYLQSTKSLVDTMLFANRESE